MNYKVLFAGLWLLGASQWALAQSAAAPPAPPEGRGAQPPKNAPKLGDPGALVRQLMRMTPEQREQALEKFPPQRQAEIRERLQRFDNLPKLEQQRQLQLSEHFASLPPEKQDLLRRQIKAFNQLPDDRRRLVGAAFQRLRRMTESDRQARFASRSFQNRFTPAEQQILADLSENLPPPTLEPPRP